MINIEYLEKIDLIFSTSLVFMLYFYECVKIIDKTTLEKMNYDFFGRKYDQRDRLQKCVSLEEFSVSFVWYDVTNYERHFPVSMIIAVKFVVEI